MKLEVKGEDYWSVNMESKTGAYCCIPVLEFLKGKPWCTESKAFVSSLRPSKVRIAKKGITLDCVNWRVTVWLNEDDTIRHIDQEVAVSTYEPVTHDERGVPDCINGGELCKWAELHRDW